MHAEALQGDGSRFGGLTFPRFAPLLKNVSPPLAAWGLSLDEFPVGLGLTRTEAGNTKLLSLYVLPHLRKAGWGSKLLRLLEETHRDLSIAIWAEYTSSLPERRAFEATLRRAGWEAPVVREMRISGLIGPAIAATKAWPGLDDERDRRIGIVFDTWSPGHADALAIGGLMSEAQFLPALAPELYAARIDSSISLAIRQRGRLIGWVFGERVANTVEFGNSVVVNCPSAYITHPLWHTGALARAYFRSLAMAREIYGDDAAAVFYAALPRLRAMAQRRSASIATSVEIFQATKRFGAANQARL
jgi:GNAT superfamily N-acetyltransferase